MESLLSGWVEGKGEGSPSEAVGGLIEEVVSVGELAIEALDGLEAGRSRGCGIPVLAQGFFEAEGEQGKAVGCVADQGACKDPHGDGMTEEKGVDGLAACLGFGVAGVDGKASVKAERVEPCAQAKHLRGCRGALGWEGGKVALEDRVQCALEVGQVL